MRVVTESGSEYDFRTADDYTLVRRVNKSFPMRMDEGWLRVFSMYPAEPTVGLRMILVLEPLGEGAVTTRTTSRVLQVWA